MYQLYARLWAIVGVAGLATATLSVMAVDGSATTSERFFCRVTIAHNYEKPFQTMPVARGLPTAGSLPFPPRGVFGRYLNASAVFPTTKRGQRVVGLEVYVPSGVRTHARLNWLVNARLSRVNVRGKPVRVLGFRIAMFQALRGKNPGNRRLGLSLPTARTGLYRLDLLFRTRGGVLLGRFQRYLRVAPAVQRSRVELLDKLHYPGDELVFRTDNLGTEPITYVDSVEIARHDGVAWRPIEVAGVGSRVIHGLDAGQASRCHRVQLPVSSSPGLYRIRQLLVGGNRDGPEYTEAAQFSVTQE